MINIYFGKFLFKEFLLFLVKKTWKLVSLNGSEKEEREKENLLDLFKTKKKMKNRC